MKLLVLGGDGYLGWPTAMYFTSKGYNVSVVDNYSKRLMELQIGVQPLLPISTLDQRTKTFYSLTGKKIQFFIGSLNDYNFFSKILKKIKPQVVIHFAEQPSAPYSMIDIERAKQTMDNNVLGTLTLLFALRDHCPDAHLVKLGTMGEYGTPNIAIEEGFITIHHKGRSDRLPFPKQAGSFYHLSKVHDSHNIMFASSIWGLRSTDLNQGIVYGIDTQETNLHQDLETSFHYDDIFGTVLNRFCTQAALQIPLTVYGGGHQKRSFININDTIKCIEIAVTNPPKKGEYRVFNQFSEVFSLASLATLIVNQAKKLDLKSKITYLNNPRVEKESHYYNPSNSILRTLGYQPQSLSSNVLLHMIKRILKYKSHIDQTKIFPRVFWK
ncbi:MAG: NAD-dependent epimerase/dehydratase family protein [Patescibacteria group bacterium]